MQVRVMEWADERRPTIVEEAQLESEHWTWVDVTAPARTDGQGVFTLLAGLDIDPLAIRDAIEGRDLPKLDDFGDHLQVVLHGLREDRIATYKVDCFLTERHLITLHREPSPAIDTLWDHVLEAPEVTVHGVDEMLAGVADVLARRLLFVLETFDQRIDSLIAMALAADERVLPDLTAIRRDLAAVRRAVNPQREVLAQLRRSSTPVVSTSARRRFSDVFDVADRSAHGLDAARSALAEALDAYRGAEARQATEVTTVLTVYAAIMLPLTLIVGFFGMNFTNLPGAESDSGIVWVSAAMLLVAVGSLIVFARVGWIRAPWQRRARIAAGRGLSEAAGAPTQVVTAQYRVSHRIRAEPPDPPAS